MWILSECKLSPEQLTFGSSRRNFGSRLPNSCSTISYSDESTPKNEYVIIIKLEKSPKLDIIIQ